MTATGPAGSGMSWNLVYVETAMKAIAATATTVRIVARTHLGMYGSLVHYTHDQPWFRVGGKLKLPPETTAHRWLPGSGEDLRVIGLDEWVVLIPLAVVVVVVAAAKIWFRTRAFRRGKRR